MSNQSHHNSSQHHENSSQHHGGPSQHSNPPHHESPRNPTTQLSPEPTQQELSDVRIAIQKLWDLDSNRLKPGVDYAINLPMPHGRNENVKVPLFKYVTDRAGKIPTFKCFYALLDNYIPQTGIAEKLDTAELKENEQFLKAALATAPMIYYLKSKGTFRGSISDFEAELNKIWFNFYRREGVKDSSAFEHVFLGEVRDGEAKAFHNWITFYFNEKAGKIDYESFIPMKEGNNRLVTPDGTEQIITLRFSFEGARKPFSTSFIGTSPEFEFGLYTLLYLLERDDTKVTLDGINLNIKIYPFHERGGHGVRLLGSAFPMIIGPH
ncbi:17628_t:CDS:2 [Acaulospora morrowiae]|uniref:17628_t:CDS:1 n=1 Tax=Acaulospora morrowiae TaxID=94023 RepID=A0A9N9CVQ6_9GLOM|nr:17628_t:CDS:2 [Acaulospora morrowiae]